MRSLVLCLCCLICHCALAQPQIIHIDPLMQGYRAEIILDAYSDPNQALQGIVNIYKQGQEQPIISYPGEDWRFAHNVLHPALTHLALNQQSIIRVLDFNFDQRSDLAIFEGPNSCYGSSSPAIFLQDDQGFEFNHELTELIASSCGAFELDAQQQRLTSLSYVGCCIKWQRQYRMQNNQLKLTSEIYSKLDKQFPYERVNKFDYSQPALNKRHQYSRLSRGINTGVEPLYLLDTDQFRYQVVISIALAQLDIALINKYQHVEFSPYLLRNGQPAHWYWDAQQRKLCTAEREPYLSLQINDQYYNLQLRYGLRQFNVRGDVGLLSTELSKLAQGDLINVGYGKCPS